MVGNEGNLWELDTAPATVITCRFSNEFESDTLYLPNNHQTETNSWVINMMRRAS